MSENIQSISLGTYSIGETNKLTFSAGPGITISEPSEGVVGIANDETVLWEGTDFTPAGSNNPVATSVSLNESINNFNQIRLDFSGGMFFTESITLTNPRIDANSWTWCSVKKEQASNEVYIGTIYKFSNENTLSGICSYGNTQVVTAMTGGYWGYGGVCKVIGINRKENT